MTIVQFPLRVGMNEGDDPTGLPPGTLTYLENCVWNKTGRVEKRNGNAALSKTNSSGTISAGRKLLARGNAPVLIDGTHVNEYAAGANRWQYGDVLPDALVNWRQVVNDPIGIKNAEVSYSSSANAYAVSWLDANAYLYVSVIDATTGGVLIARQQITSSTTSSPRITAIGGYALVTYVQSGTIYAVRIELSTFTTTSPTALRADFSGDTFAATAVGTNLVIAYVKFAASDISVYAYDTSFAQTLTGSLVEGAGVQSLSISGNSSDLLWVGYEVAGTGVRCGVLAASSLATALAPFTVDGGAASTDTVVGIARVSNTTAVIAYSYGTLESLSSQVVSSLGATTAFHTSKNARLIGEPIVVAGGAYILAEQMSVTSGQAYASTALILEARLTTDSFYGDNTPHKIVGVVNPRLAPGKTMAPWRGTVVSATKIAWVAPVDSTGLAVRGIERNGALMLEMTAGAAAFQSASVHGTVFFSGGATSFYDGSRTLDCGYVVPARISVAHTSSGAGNVGAGTYLYTVVPVYVDDNGITHRGPPSTPVSITVAGATNTNTLTIDTYTAGSKELLTAQSKSTYFEVYRSTADSSSLFRLTIDTTGANAPKKNDPSASVVTFADTYSDTSVGATGAALNTQAPLYTTGGVLEDQAPPSSIFVHTHRNRVWLISGDKRTLYFSKNYEEDTRFAPGFNDDLTIMFEEDLVALATLDDKLIVFGDKSIWFISGDGPGASGLQSDYFIQKLQTDVGCSNYRSIVGCSAGIFFQATRGIHLLDRGLSLTWVGRTVRDELVSYPGITSAVLVGKYNQVRFTASNGVNGISLVFDYVTGQWAVFKYYDSDAATAATIVADACVVNGVYTWCTPGGQVYQETESDSLDSGSFVAYRVDVAPLSASGPVGFQHVRRVQLLAEDSSPSDLTMRFAFDYSASYAQSYTWTAAALATLGSRNVGMRVGCQNGASPRCTAIAVSVSDATPTGESVGTGKGSLLSAVAFEIISRSGMQRRGANAEA